MSSTRHAAPGSPFRPERYCSSPEFNTALPGNLVARRCSVLRDRAERELIYFVQSLSQKEGGLEDLCAALRARYAHQIGTPTMLRLRKKPTQDYSAPDIRAIRAELPGEIRDAFLLRGERSSLDALLGEGSYSRRQDVERQPHGYPVTKLQEVCNAAVDRLEADLREWCLNPAVEWEAGGPWYFRALKSSLREYMAAWIAEQTAGAVTTEIGKRVDETLDYALAEKCLVVIEGRARMGKTVAAKNWCARHPGLSRYVQVPSTNDEHSFYRTVAKSIGIGAGQSLKGTQVRQKVEDTLQGCDLLLVLDEAHYLWPQQARMRDTLPRRINWLMTALVNHGIPVALVTTPQFFQCQRVIERSTHWASEQFIGRISHFERLAETLSEEDLSAVARAIFPEGNLTAIKGLVAYARTSAKYLAGIEAVVKRARFLARRAGRAVTTEADIRDAIVSSAVPSDSALAQALGLSVAAPERPARRSLRKPVSGAVQGVRKSLAGAVQDAPFAVLESASALAAVTV